MSVDILAAIFDPRKIDLIEIVHFLLALYLSITVHEAAHAWMAHRCGDDTARLMGRMTLNPIAHIDPIGTVLMPLMQVLFAGLPLIGWAKPVPVNPIHFRNMRRGEILVSFAGPAANFILMVAAFLICVVIMYSLGVVTPDVDGIFGPKPDELLKSGDYTMNQQIGQSLYGFMFRLMVLNLVLGMFNLIPISPLDGSHILKVFISRQAAGVIDHFLMPPFNFIVLLLVVLPLVQPVFGLIYRLIVDALIALWP